MSSKNEILSTSSEAPLLNELQSTIKNRWAAFDAQLPTGKSLNEDYRSIKNAYDGIMSNLASVKTDTELTQNEKIKGKLDEFLGKLTQYLQSDTRRRELDGILVDTNTQFKALRDKIYGQQQVAEVVQAESGKLRGEVVTNKLASTPDKKPETLPTTAEAAATVAAVGGGTGVVAAIESGSKKAEEAVKGIMKPLEKIKKWSSDIGDAWDAGWELVKKGDISKGIGLFFAVLFGGNLKDALAKYTGKSSPEENLSEKKEQEDKEKKSKETAKLLEDGVIVKTAGHMIRGTNKQEYGNFLGALWGGVRDGSIYRDESEFRDRVETESIDLITSGELSEKSYADLQKMSEAELVKTSGPQTDKNTRIAACRLIQRMLISNQSSLDQVFGNQTWRIQSMKDILSQIYTQKGYNYVLQMNEKLSKFSIADIATLPRTMFVDFESQDGVISLAKGSLAESRFEQLKQSGFSLSLMQSIMSTHEKSSVEQFKTIIKLDLSEKKFIDVITDNAKFLDPLKQSLSQYFGMNDTLTRQMNFQTLTMKDLFELYLITGGVTDISRLNLGEQSMLSLKCLSILSRLDPNGTTDYLKFVEENANRYPIISKIGTQAGGIANATMYHLGKTSSDIIVKIAEAAGIDTKTEAFATAVGAVGGIWMIAKLLPIGRLIGLITLVGGGLAVTGLAAAQQSANSK